MTISNSISRKDLVNKVAFILLIISVVLFVVRTTMTRGYFEYIGVDYRLWYSTGLIIRNHGIQNIYNYDLQGYYQRQLFDTYSIPNRASMDFWPLPLPYLSVFTLPMVLLTLLEPMPGFVIWTVINLGVAYYFLSRFIGKSHLNLPRIYILIIFFSFPFLLNTLFAQVNLLLLISVGEFIVNLRDSKNRTAGGWLTGLLIKPQLLLLLIPGLIYLRKWKILAGFAIGGLLVVLGSLLLVGFSGSFDYASTILNWPSVLGDSGMNLLALSTNLNKFLPDIISKTLILFLYLLFLLLIIINWIDYRINYEKSSFEALLLATFLTTFTLSPHSNVYMAIMIIPLGFILLDKKILSERLAFYWCLFPVVLFLLVGTYSVGAAHAVGGMSMLFVNMLVSNRLLKNPFRRSIFRHI